MGTEVTRTTCVRRTERIEPGCVFRAYQDFGARAGASGDPPNPKDENALLFIWPYYALRVDVAGGFRADRRQTFPYRIMELTRYSGTIFPRASGEVAPLDLDLPGVGKVVWATRQLNR